MGPLDPLPVIVLNALLCFINGDFALDMLFGGFYQKTRRFEAIDCLKPNGNLSSIGTCRLVWFTLADIFFKFKVPRLHLVIHTNLP